MDIGDPLEYGPPLRREIQNPLARISFLASPCNTYPVTIIDTLGRSQQVSHETLTTVVDEVKSLCQVAAVSLIAELSSQFPASNLMDTLGVVYPQYWLQPHAEELFKGHFAILKNHYCYEKKIGDICSPPVLDLSALNHECSQFKGAMKANAPNALQKPITLNPLTKLWQTLSMSMVLKKHFKEWFKVAELAAAQVLGLVEDERIFSTVAFSKSRLLNRLSEHLPACVGVYNQSFYQLDDFPFDKVYDDWHADRRRQLDC